ncbi:MAG: BlaI/MecI/CopY family transcriptional regulator [Prevotella sp.]|nr:BlaI/MecI/CopY family transcriptional regulator [Prevotella sp.]MBR3079227.1 BlaI/MecI/CopY family transcriptional regulator [Prevotella sp.]
MKKLTNKEREVMELFWKYGPMFVRELLEHYEEPRPHFNTLSTIVRRLEQGGYIGHKRYGSTYQYHALISEKDYAKRNIFQLVDDYIEDSYTGIVTTFLKEEKLTVDELRELISQVEVYKESKQ